MKRLHELEGQPIFEVYGNSDTTEGRGSKVHIGYFTDEGVAHKAAKGQGVMGTEATVKLVTAPTSPVVYETFAEYGQACKQQEYRAIMAKLSDREKEILGLNVLPRA
jgi:hypothetical protein